MKTHFLAAFVLLSFYCCAQPDFNHAFFNKMNMNPAYTGVQDISSPDTILHKQVEFFYNSLHQSYTHLIATFQMPLNTIHSGIGATINCNGDEYEFSEYAAKLFYSYTIVPGLYVGASAGFVDMHLAYISFNSPTNFTSPDVDLGILGQTKSVFFGLALGHLNSPAYSEVPGYSEPMPYYTGITYNSMLGCNLNIHQSRLCLMACFYNNDLSAHLLFYPNKFFFIGFSSTVYYDGVNKVPLISQDFKRGDYSCSFIVGFSLFNNKLNISVAITQYPSKYNGNYPISEGLLGYGF